jgi:hypothetical protein
VSLRFNSTGDLSFTMWRFILYNYELISWVERSYFSIFVSFFRFFKDFWSFFKSWASVGKLFRYTIGGCRFENMKVHIIRILLEHMQSKRSYIKYFLYDQTVLQEYRYILDPPFLKSPHFTITQNPAVDRQPGYRWGTLRVDLFSKTTTPNY